MSRYYRESYRFPRFKMFFDSESADITVDRGNLTYMLQKPVFIPNDVTCYVQLAEMTIPNTGYNVDTGNNTLTFEDVDTSPYTITVPPGNYNANTLLTVLNEQFSSYSGANSISVTYYPLTNIFMFTSSNPNTGGTHLSFTFNADGKSTMMKVLGFESNTSYQSGNSGNPALVSVRQIDLSGNNSFYFTTNMQTENIAWLNQDLSNNGRGSNVIGKVQFTCANGGVQFFTQVKDFKTRVTDKTISMLNVQLLDENYKAWVPEQQYNFTLEFTFMEMFDPAVLPPPRNILHDHRYGIEGTPESR